MDLASLITGSKGKLTWGSAIALWDIARLKIVGIPIMNIFEASAKDTDLKVLINLAVNRQILPQVNRVKVFLEKEGLTGPDIPTPKNLKNTLDKLEPNAIITDVEIARALREILKYGIELDTRGLAETSRKDVRELIQDLLDEDLKAFNNLIDFKKKKNWVFNPPSI